VRASGRSLKPSASRAEMSEYAWRSTSPSSRGRSITSPSIEADMM
jgi:hypothetical protein